MGNEKCVTRGCSLHDACLKIEQMNLKVWFCTFALQLFPKITLGGLSACLDPSGLASSNMEPLASQTCGGARERPFDGPYCSGSTCKSGTSAPLDLGSEPGIFNGDYTGPAQATQSGEGC